MKPMLVWLDNGKKCCVFDPHNIIFIVEPKKSGQMELPKALTAEQLQGLKEKYPRSMEVFEKWLKEFGKLIKYGELFNDGYYIGGTYTKAPKFVELAHCFQLGIWIEFIRQQGTEQYLIQFPNDLAESMDTYFCAVLEPNLKNK